MRRKEPKFYKFIVDGLLVDIIPDNSRKYSRERERLKTLCGIEICLATTTEIIDFQRKQKIREARLHDTNRAHKARNNRTRIPGKSFIPVKS